MRTAKGFKHMKLSLTHLLHSPMCVWAMLSVSKPNQTNERKKHENNGKSHTHEEQQREEKKLVLIKVFVYVAV